MAADSFLIVDDQPISLGQALKYLQSSGKLGAFVGGILRQHVIEQELQTVEGLDVNSAAIEQAVIDFRLQRQLTDPKVFQEWLKSNKTDYATFHSQVSYGFKLSKLKSRIAQPKLQEYFIERKLFLDRVILSRIIVDSQELAEELRTQIDEGANFEQLAREYSLTDDRVVNGMMGPVSRGTLPDRLRAVVDSVSPREIVGPLELDNRWALFRVEQILPASLEDGQLREALLNELFERWLAEKIQKLTVKLQVRQAPSEEAREIYSASIPWDKPPLALLTPEQQVRFKHQAEICRYTLGGKIWSTERSDDQFLVVSGKVRLREEGATKPLATLETGDWFGGLQQLSGLIKAVASSKEVVVVRWDVNLWKDTASSAIDQFWHQSRAEVAPQTIDTPQSVSGYPFVASMNSAAACLTMVAQQLQNPTQLEWVQRQLRGQRPQHLVAAGEKLGLHLRRLVTTWHDLPQLSFPALIQLRTGNSPSLHWVVVYALKGDRLIIADPLNPSQTCERVPRSVVEAAWDGQLWQVELIQKQDKFNLSWFLPAVWRYRNLLLEVLLASFTLQLLGLATPVITQVIIDKVMVQESLATLDVMVIALLGAELFQAILGILRLFIFTHTARRLDLSLSAQVFRHLMRLPLAYFESRRVGDTVARVQELENIRQFLTGTALTVILDSIFAVVYLAVMVYYNIELTLVALAVIPLFAILTLVATPILRNWLNETFNRSADSQSFLVETITGIHAVKAHAAEGTTRIRWEGLFARYIRTGFKASTTSNISNNIGDFLTHFSNLLILWFGARLVIDHQLTIGQLVAFQMLSGRMTGPLLRLVQLWQNLQQVLLSVDRIGDILNVAPEAEPGSGLVLPPLKGQVTFDQVFFRYRPNQQPILRGISFTVQPGMFVGIVGRSGSGKSTLSKLLQRLYLVESGRILIDGFDIKSADIGSLRQQIGVVLQEDFLFNASILENITLGNPDISAEQVVEAARMAVAHDFISELTHGYETNVGERGTALSGGQRQRIALARLFLSQAPILILDEATSALDSETEQQVLQNLQRISQNRTVFLIAHRFAPLKRADLILVMEKGVLVEQGTHEQLIGQKGLYWSLYQRQQSNL